MPTLYKTLHGTVIFFQKVNNILKTLEEREVLFEEN